MRFKVLGWLGVLLGAILLTPVVAQQGTETATDQTAGEKRGFWDRFPLYLEVQAGQAASEDISTSVRSSETLDVRSFVDIDEAANTKLSVGWTLPEGKGQFRLTFTSFNEDSYTFRSDATRQTASSGETALNNIILEEGATWWNVSIENGTFRSSSLQPTWTPALTQDVVVGPGPDGVLGTPDDEIETQILDPRSDINENGVADPNELDYLPTPFGVTKSVTDSLDNQVQFADLMYERDFGGRRYGARWGAGLRYFAYEGNLPAAAWLSLSFRNTSQVNGGYQNFTNGSLADLISMHTKSDGLGPSGKADFQIKFFRERLKLTAGVRAAFIFQQSEVRSNEFFSFVTDTSTNTQIPAPATIIQKRDKDVWHTGVEGGVQYRVAPGLTLMASYFLERYADAILLPRSFALPEKLSQAGQGVVALYRTKDFTFDGWRAGLGFQF